MARVGVGVEVADRDRVDSHLLEPGDGPLEGTPVDRRGDLAVEPHALADPEPAPARGERDRRRHAQVVAIVLEPFPHLDQVPVAFRGEHADLGALALEERVGRHGRPVDDEIGGRQQCAGIHAELGRQEPEAVHHTDRRVLWG